MSAKCLLFHSDIGVIGMAAGGLCGAMHFAYRALCGLNIWVNIWEKFNLIFFVNEI